MSTMTGNLRRAMLLGAVGLLVLAGAGRVVQADVASDKPGAVLIFPKIVVDTSGTLFGVPTDTEVQLTNTSNSVVAAHCFIIDTTSRCSNSGVACTAEAAAEGRPEGQGGCATGASCLTPCTPKVVENDFPLLLTKRQPISWRASEGLSGLPCGVRGQGPGCTGSNGTSYVANSQTDPWVGEIKCVQVDPVSGAPTSGLDPANNFGGDLKGEATIVRHIPSTSIVDARKYNGIGLQATANFPAPTDANGNPVLSIGGATPQYNGCPKVVILDHMFDNAPVITHRGGAPAPVGNVVTDLTVVPCSEDLATQTPRSATLQFLVYNEFEQRFSTSTSFSCFKEVQLSDIDTRPGNVQNNNYYSIFNANVQGTMTGQTRIRPVASATSDRRVLAVSEAFFTGGALCPNGVCSSAANTYFVPGTGVGDTLTIYPGVVPGQ